MNFSEATKILGINSDFTEEELRRVYRNLMRKYHPDANIDKSEEELKLLEEKAKEVNGAYEFLYKNFQTKYMDEYINFLHNELLKYNNLRVIYSCLAPYQIKVANIILDFSLYTKGKKKEKIDALFQEAKRKIKSIFDELCDSYFKQYGIGLEYKSELYYEVSLQDFYEQLKK